MKKLVLGFVVCLVIAAPALANITIRGQYPGAPYTDTLYGINEGPGYGDGPFYIPYDDGGWKTNIPNIGQPLPLVATCTPPREGFLNGWWDGYVYGKNDVHILIPYIPNLYNPDLTKLIQVEIVYWVAETGPGNGLDGYALLGPAGTGNPKPEVGLEALGDGFYDVTLTWKVWPQPEWEGIMFTLLGTNGVTAESVEVATVCIPAPAAVILGGIGVGLVGWLRRRRCL